MQAIWFRARQYLSRGKGTSPRGAIPFAERQPPHAPHSTNKMNMKMKDSA